MKVFYNSYWSIFNENRMHFTNNMNWNKKNAFERWKKRQVLLQLWKWTKSFYLSKKIVSATFNKHTCVSAFSMNIGREWHTLLMFGLNWSSKVWALHTAFGRNISQVWAINVFRENCSCILHGRNKFLLELFCWLFFSSLITSLVLISNETLIVIWLEEMEMTWSKVWQYN